MSEIISIDIDETFPVAGQDNDSQGFRDNFSVIKNSLATAKAEISSLEEITAKKNQDNDFNDNEIQRAVFIQTTEKVVSQATGVSMSLHWTYGSYQEIVVTSDLSLTLGSWPEAGVMGADLVLPSQLFPRVARRRKDGECTALLHPRVQ